MTNAFYLAIVLTFILVFYAVRKYYQYLGDVTDLKLLEIQLTTKIEPEDVKQLLDDFIADTFDDYLLNNSDIIQKTYITSDNEVKMREELAVLVADRLSPYLYQKIAVYYNERIIPDIIATRIYQLTTAYVVENNKLKNSKDEMI